MKLIQSMRHEYEAVQGAKGAQEDELRRLKERMLLGVRSAFKLHIDRDLMLGLKRGSNHLLLWPLSSSDINISMNNSSYQPNHQR